MRCYPTLTWEYGPQTREILAARDRAALLEEAVNMEECEEVALSLRHNDREEARWKDVEANTRPRGTAEATTRGNQNQEAQ
jgi:hypothetical protein